VVDLDTPLPPGFALPGATLTSIEADGHRASFSLDSMSAGAAVAQLIGAASVRDLSLVEPDIEDVVARLYAATDAP
jgi:ABC-2 type transport system ATP-binding protein